jgi:hypothetical protein
MRRIPLVLLGLAGIATLSGQNDWPAYGHDPGGMRYSPLAQIDIGNVARLAPAWTYHTGEKGRQFESTPLVVGAVMYVSTQGQRVVARLEATGNATPISYQGRSGKQYVVIAAGGPGHLRNVGDTSKNSSDTLVAFSLSEHAPATSDAKPAPSPVSVAGQAGVPSDVGGNSLVVRICTKCHGLDTFGNYRLSAEEWQNEVQDMVARGAQGTGEEIRAVTDFLIRNLGKRAGARN